MASRHLRYRLRWADALADGQLYHHFKNIALSSRAACRNHRLIPLRRGRLPFFAAYPG